MKKPHGSQVARTEVTQYIIQYIKDNKLQWTENRKVIKPDGKLNSLLDVPVGEEVTYFNLQRFMNRHFVKGGSNVKTA
jgi:chromatin remodeling complex protein RSC6